MRENHTMLNVEEIDFDRETLISACLIGSQNCPPYEKARCLSRFRNQELMSYDTIISLCGGNRSEIDRKIEAYHDMNDYYLDVLRDDEFKMDRYSGFVELQKPGIKKAIYGAGLGLEDFGEWIRSGRIYRMADVRQLPRVLGDKEARDIFLKGGIDSIGDAVRLLERRLEKRSGVMLEGATVHELAEILTERIDKITWLEAKALGDKNRNENAQRKRVLENLAERLHDLLEYVPE